MGVPERKLVAAEALARLVNEDAMGQLRQRAGAMARLGSEGGALKLDWVGMLSWLLAHAPALEQVEAEALAMIARGVRHVIWAGMGGSVLAVRALTSLGYGAGKVAIHPLDSTDPAALNALLAEVGSLDGVEMVAVALGMTSEEPISHLIWFGDALVRAGLEPATRQTVMALPDSYLDRYARERGIPSLPLQLDGGVGINGRMSAPGTRVFLLPAALWLAGRGRDIGALSEILALATDLTRAPSAPPSQWARLAAELAAASVDGVVRLCLETPPGWEAVRDWAEQLMEESLGKGDKGVIVFAPGALPADAPASLRLRLSGDEHEEPGQRGGEFVLVAPLIGSSDARQRLAGLAALFQGLQITMALYGYLWNIPFAGQPAVEAYKARARALRDSGADELARPLFASAPLRVGALALLPPQRGFDPQGRKPLSALRAWLLAWRANQPLAYLDLTVNGEATLREMDALNGSLRRLATGRLGMPYKLRRAPAAYHSTEQSEMDGPEGVVSIRALALKHEVVVAGGYSARFLEAQAVATWQAMNAQGRPCFLALYDGDMTGAVAALAALLDTVAVEI